jgi:hypothetical protein
VLAYLLVEFGEDDGTGELQIPDTVNMSELIEAANEIDVLNAPINIRSHVNVEARFAILRLYVGTRPTARSPLPSTKFRIGR